MTLDGFYSYCYAVLLKKKTLAKHSRHGIKVGAMKAEMRIAASAALVALSSVWTANAAQPAPAAAAASTAMAPELQQALREIVRAVRISTELLEAVHDKATADAAAEPVAQQMALLAVLSPALEYIPEAALEQALAANGMSQARMQAITKEMVIKRFYGSIALAQALGQPPYAAVGLSEPTPELLAELELELRTAIEGKAPGMSGGPGFTEETAWQLGADKAHLQYIRTVMGALPGAIKEAQNLVHTQGGKVYGRMTFILVRNEKCYRLEMWFDVTQQDVGKRYGNANVPG